MVKAHSIKILQLWNPMKSKNFKENTSAHSSAFKSQTSLRPFSLLKCHLKNCRGPGEGARHAGKSTQENIPGSITLWRGGGGESELSGEYPLISWPVEWSTFITISELSLWEVGANNGVWNDTVKRKSVFLCCKFHLKSTFLWQRSASVSKYINSEKLMLNPIITLLFRTGSNVPFKDSVFLEEWLILNSWRCILFPTEKGILLWFSLIDTGVAMHVVKTASYLSKISANADEKLTGISVIASKYPTTIKNMEGKPEGILRK